MKIQIGSTIKYDKPSRDRRSGDNLVKGMTGIVRKILPANETVYPMEGDKIEAEFVSGYGCRFAAWVTSNEIQVISHG